MHIYLLPESNQMPNIVQLCPGNDKIGMAFNERMKVPVAISNKLGVLVSKDPATP